MTIAPWMTTATIIGTTRPVVTTTTERTTITAPTTRTPTIRMRATMPPPRRGRPRPRPRTQRSPLDHNWNNWHQPVNVGRWDHNGFWNNNWNARNFNCPNCRWGWVGPVFWPFGWGDMFSFAWWPYAATAPFWNYNVDYIMGGLFWPNGAYAWPSGGYGATAWTQNDNSYTYARQSHQDIYSSGPADGSDDQQAAAPAADDSQNQDLATCSGFAPGVSSLPIDKIQQSVKPTGMQLTALKGLQSASSEAEGILKASCPSSPPLTPVGRLDALQKRLDAMVKGLDLVRAPLTKFDQFAVGRAEAAARRHGRRQGGERGRPVLDAERGVHQRSDAGDRSRPSNPTRSRRRRSTSSTASRRRRPACCRQPAHRRSRRRPRPLEAMDKRLKATVTAMNEVRPALVGFYNSLGRAEGALRHDGGPLKSRVSVKWPAVLAPPAFLFSSPLSRA